jgi:hypothetical protein
VTTTGLLTHRCYAAAYGDCDGGAATREHWISRALLERVRYGGVGLRVAGLSWFEGERVCSDAELVSRILCGRHNGMLNELDDSIATLHDAWLEVGEGHETRLTISGDMLERWALKVLAGMMVSGTARVDGIPIKVPAPLALVDVVFGARDIRSPRGFYFVVHNEFDGGLKIKVHTGHPGTELEGIALGISVQFLAFRYMTWLRSTPVASTELLYRPAALDFGPVGRIDFQWKDGPGSGDIPLDLRINRGAEGMVGHP